MRPLPHVNGEYMTRAKFKILNYLVVLAPLLGAPISALAQVDTVAEATKCMQNLQFSDVSYDELKTKLTATLDEKNKSLIFLDFRGLQAQVDILVTHLMMSNETYSKKDSTEILLKVTSYLDQLESLLAKAKSNAKIIKDEHVVPLATLTSLKAEYDHCQGINSEFPIIFKHLSQLNKDLNEILMLSPAHIIAQKDTVKNLIKKIEDKNTGLSARSIAEPLNFIQNQIVTVTQTFEFDTKTLNIAKN
jgi:hypothetical protein